MIILSDSRQQKGKHTIKEKWFADNGIELRTTKLYVGDYTLPTDQSVCVDTKKDIQELIGDVCGKQHTRFRDECVRAQESNIQLYIVVENRGGLIKGTRDIYNPQINRLEELHNWKNPRLFIFRAGKQLYPTATRGITLQKICHTMQTKYGVKFLFCKPEESAPLIFKLLTKGAKIY